MTTQYEKDLAELKRKGIPTLKDLAELTRRRTELAREYIPKLYKDLRNENVGPLDARDRIERDCADLWSKATILKYLRPECKDIDKAEAGRKGGRQKALSHKASASARMNLAENRSICQKGQESREKIMAMTIDTSGRSPAYASEAGGDDRSQPAEGSPFASDRKEIKALRMKVQEKDDCIKELERQVHELREALTKSTSRPQMVCARNLLGPTSAQVSRKRCRSNRTNAKPSWRWKGG
jgi:hypothetical protein